ncbi:hypothetical protein [Kosakonia sp. MUSA4]|uniref:hypothetical protein n=1 Tax=Kosakonia sp. MUSA4 TaxID=2067958 RepID=UPI001ABF7207|nr:hypothetical protein [Kosakonia sp. MUSA4]
MSRSIKVFTGPTSPAQAVHLFIHPAARHTACSVHLPAKVVHMFFFRTIHPCAAILPRALKLQGFLSCLKKARPVSAKPEHLSLLCVAFHISSLPYRRPAERWKTLCAHFCAVSGLWPLVWMRQLKTIVVLKSTTIVVFWLFDYYLVVFMVFLVFIT